jgi:hypothetical protein
MPAHSWFDVIPLWAVFAGSLAGILLLVELGHRLGRWRRARSQGEKEAPVGGMVTAELGLLAFLLAIAFSLAANRFDDRRTVLLDETNAIGTCYLRAGILPDSHRGEVRRLLREYVDARLAGARGHPLESAIRRSEDLHNELWAHATAAAQQDPKSIQTALFVESLNDVIDFHAKRLQAALRSRLPGTVWAILFTVAALSFAMVGYHAGLSGTTRSPAVLPVALAFAAVLWMVADLERPHQGMLRVSQQPMIDLQKSMSGPNVERPGAAEQFPVAPPTTSLSGALTDRPPARPERPVPLEPAPSARSSNSK